VTLNRWVNIGGDHLTSGLAEALGISYEEAEGIKVGMPSEVQHNLEPLIAPLGRELRTSIEFFEHQQDKALTQVFISGGSSRGEFIVATLQNELMAPCQTWNPDRKSTRLNSSHEWISYAVFCLKKKKTKIILD